MQMTAEMHNPCSRHLKYSDRLYFRGTNIFQGDQQLFVHLPLPQGVESHYRPGFVWRKLIVASEICRRGSAVLWVLNVYASGQRLK